MCLVDACFRRSLAEMAGTLVIVTEASRLRNLTSAVVSVIARMNRL